MAAIKERRITILLGDELFDVCWLHYPDALHEFGTGIVRCLIRTHLSHVSVASSRAYCSSKDKWNPTKGEKVSFREAIKCAWCGQAGKHQRAELWTAYLAQNPPPSKQLQPRKDRRRPAKHNDMAHVDSQVSLPLELQTELKALLNKHNAENGSNTPDFLLAEHLLSCLHAFNTGVNRREQWYSRGTKRIANLPREQTNDLGAKQPAQLSALTVCA